LLVVAAAAGSTAFLLAGLLPAYDFAPDGGVVPNAGERCPEATPTEQGYDVSCVRRLVARGPLYLGKEALAASAALGFGAIGGSGQPPIDGGRGGEPLWRASCSLLSRTCS
jgi:hypothetical protein